MFHLHIYEFSIAIYVIIILCTYDFFFTCVRLYVSARCCRAHSVLQVQVAQLTSRGKRIYKITVIKVKSMSAIDVL